MDELPSELGDKLFRDAVAEIEREYFELQHHYGWVFLHTPAGTLARNTKLFLMALNPYSKQQNSPPKKSNERGNGYAVDKWRGNKPSTLQRQVCAFYSRLAATLGTDLQQLMNSSLAVNFCPFGSPSWGQLHAKKQSIAFSITLWTRIVRCCAPSAIVCLGDVCYRSMSVVASDCAYRGVQDPRYFDTGWGKNKYMLDEMAGANRLLLVRLPHLSRYQIFGRIPSAGDLQPMYDKLGEYLG